MARVLKKPAAAKVAKKSWTEEIFIFSAAEPELGLFEFHDVRGGLVTMSSGTGLDPPTTQPRTRHWRSVYRLKFQEYNHQVDAAADARILNSTWLRWMAPKTFKNVMKGTYKYRE